MGEAGLLEAINRDSTHADNAPNTGTTFQSVYKDGTDRRLCLCFSQVYRFTGVHHLTISMANDFCEVHYH
jgi:hypothetical protein